MSEIDSTSCAPPPTGFGVSCGGLAIVLASMALAGCAAESFDAAIANLSSQRVEVGIVMPAPRFSKFFSKPSDTRYYGVLLPGETWGEKGNQHALNAWPNEDVVGGYALAWRSAPVGVTEQWSEWERVDYERSPKLVLVFTDRNGDVAGFAMDETATPLDGSQIDDIDDDGPWEILIRGPRAEGER